MRTSRNVKLMSRTSFDWLTLIFFCTGKMSVRCPIGEWARQRKEKQQVLVEANKSPPFNASSKPHLSSHFFIWKLLLQLSFVRLFNDLFFWFSIFKLVLDVYSIHGCTSKDFHKMIEYFLIKSAAEFYNPWIGMFGDRKLPSNNQPFPVLKLVAGHVRQITGRHR